MSPKQQPADSPQDPKFKVIFALYSWWISFDKRTFVICQRWNDAEGNVKYLEILEKDLELLKVIPFEVFYNEFKLGKLTRTSTSNNDQQPPIPDPYLWPDRVY